MRASDGDAEECLGHILRDIKGVAMDRPVIGGAILARVARGRVDLVDELVPGLVGCHALADPVVVAPYTFVGEVVARYQQQVGPLVSPVVDELRPLH